MEELSTLRARWGISPADACEQISRAKTPRERARWQMLWVRSRGWSATQVAQALERDPHTIGAWIAAFARGGPAVFAFEQRGGSPPARQPEQQAALKTAVEGPPAQAGVPPRSPIGPGAALSRSCGTIVAWR